MSSSQSPVPEAPAPPPASSQRPSGGAGRAIGVVFASLLGLVGIALLLGGIGVLGLEAFARDDDGYLSPDPQALSVGSYAISSDELDLSTDAASVTPDDVFGTVRISAERGDGGPVFVGVGASTDVSEYLDGVGYSEIEEFEDERPTFREIDGGAPAGPPGREDFWVAQASGTGNQVMTWEPESGNWSVVIMNANASRGVSVDADVGIKISWLLWLGIGLALVGLVLAAIGTLIVVRLLRR